MKQPYLIIAGPTASGKTALSVLVAKALSGEVVSADSMQIYDGVQVGTARPTVQEMEGVPHHLLGFLPLQEKYSVARYLEDAHRVFSDVIGRGALPVMCGGTGLYIQSFMENRQLFPQEPDPALRNRFLCMAQEQGPEVLMAELHRVDPESAFRLHSNDLHRVIRALEVFYTTGTTIGEQDRLSRSVPSPYDPCLILLDAHDRQFLYDRIDRRVDGMLADGLMEEARRVLDTDPDATVTQAIGYKEFAPYFRGECSLAEAADGLRRQTRRYAKRQLSWFRRMPAAKTLYIDEYENGADMLEEVLCTFRRFCAGKEPV